MLQGECKLFQQMISSLEKSVFLPYEIIPVKSDLVNRIPSILSKKLVDKIILLIFCEIFIAVEKVLPQVIPSVTPDKARTLFLESRQRGVAVVIVTVKVIPLK